MKKIVFDCFEIFYSNKDEKYIELLTQNLKNNYLSIMNFFNIKKFERKIIIKLWDNINDYRMFFNEKMKKHKIKVKEWEVGRSTNNPRENRIDLLCLEERKKCRGHQDDNINHMIKVCIHEFVHTCHFTYNNYTESMTWFSEALATSLSNQYGDLNFIDCKLNDILNGTATYFNYYSMGNYLLNNYSKEYILELAKNKDLLEKNTPTIFFEALNYLDNISNKKTYK